ncbi:acyl carrier protein [Bacillus toyonensis]|uniref:acyl carrier protein n=1 Tax=Bacillus toyonensis TaxID=155322 RepID=UPI002E1D09EE|nr:acyl carrier protein [Bacillus toyonensis]MED2737259.1 acyl carrier protein [Bacillus toyonensis]
MTTFEKLSDMIADRLGVDQAEIKLESKFKEDLGADSLDTVEFIMELEDEFGVEVPDEEAEKLTTVGDVVTFLEKHM